jgi:hypothetical protein
MSSSLITLTSHLFILSDNNNDNDDDDNGEEEEGEEDVMDCMSKIFPTRT